MPQAFIRDPTPAWLKPGAESVTDSNTTKALRALAKLIGANDPTSQVMGVMTSGMPAGGAGGALDVVKKALRKARPESARGIVDATLDGGGYTVHPTTGEVIRPGTPDTAMAGKFANNSGRVVEVPVEEFSPAVVQRFKKANQAELAKDPNAYIGTWVSTKPDGTKTVSLEISKRDKSVRAATVRAEHLGGPTVQRAKAGEGRSLTPGVGVRDPETGNWVRQQDAVWDASVTPDEIAAGKESVLPVGNLGDFLRGPEFQDRLNEMALVGHQAMPPGRKNWWDITSGSIMDAYGTAPLSKGQERLPTISGMLAASSPQNAPVPNTQWASELVRRAIKDEPMVQPNWRAPATAMGNQEPGSGFTPSAGKAEMATTTWGNNAGRVIEGRYDALQSDKVNDMFGALMGKPRAVIDRHYAKIAEDPARGIYTNEVPNKVGGSMGTGQVSEYALIENAVRDGAKAANAPLEDFSAWVWEGIRDTIRKTGTLFGQKHRASAIPDTTTGFNEVFTDLVEKKARHLGVSVDALIQKLRAGDESLLTAILATGMGAETIRRFRQSQTGSRGASGKTPSDGGPQ